MELHDYQKRAIQFVLQKKSVFLMADVGLGKTVISLKAIEKVRIPTIVFAPLAVIYSTWPDEIKKWTPGLTYTILHGSRKNQRITFDRDIYLVNYDGMKWFYSQCINRKFRLRKSFMVYDESSFVKSPSTQRFKLLKKLAALFSPYRLCLSATPMPNGLHELWSQYWLLDQGKSLGTSYYSFRNKYFNYSGPPIYKMWPRHNAQEKIFDATKERTFRLSAEDYLKMPEVIYNKIKVTLPANIKAQYDKFEKDFFMEVDKMPVNVVNSAAMSMKLRQFVQGFVYGEDKRAVEIHTCKLDLLKAMIEGAAGNPILAAVQFHHEVEMIKRLDKNVPLITGKTPAATKLMHIREWNDGRLPLLLCHPKSLGYGTNLQAGGHILLWYAFTWSLDQYIQLIGRLARQGQLRGVVVNHFVAEGTVDEIMMGVVKSKDNSQGNFLKIMNEYRRNKYGE